MGDIFYTVRHIMNGREGCLPSHFSSKEEAIEFIRVLRSKECADVKHEFHLYEVKEIAY